MFERTKKLYSRDFLGVRLVRLQGAPRKAVRVAFDYYAAALLPNGTVAIASEDVFKPTFERSSWHRIRAAKLLGMLGAIPAADANAYVARLASDKKRKDAEWAQGSLEDAAKTLGLKLTRQQKAKIKRQVQDP